MPVPLKAIYDLPGPRGHHTRPPNRRPRGQCARPKAAGSPALSPGSHYLNAATTTGRGPSRGNHTSVGKKLTSVVEEHDSVAQQAPSLFWMSGYGAGGIAVGSRCVRALGKMATCRGSGSG